MCLSGSKILSHTLGSREKDYEQQEQIAPAKQKGVHFLDFTDANFTRRLAH